jgi:hypothetical protein
MKSRWLVAAASALALAALACGKPVSNGPAPRDRNVLTYDEIVNSAHAGSDLFEAVQSLRPHFLEPPPGVAPGSVSHTGTVYIDSRRAGGLEALHSLTAGTVEEVRYLGATQSQNEYGPRATLFTLVVRLRRARPDTTFGVTLSGR